MLQKEILDKYAIDDKWYIDSGDHSMGVRDDAPQEVKDKRKAFDDYLESMTPDGDIIDF
jgi:hypothetical protein